MKSKPKNGKREPLKIVMDIKIAETKERISKPMEKLLSMLAEDMFELFKEEAAKEGFSLASYIEKNNKG